MDRFIELEGIYAGYGPRTVIHDLDARFPRHRVTALLGPGASGKSTLLQVLEGVKDDPWSIGSVPALDGWRLPQRSRDGTAKVEADSWDDAVAVLARWLRGRTRLLSPSMWTALLSCPSVLTRLATVLKARAEVLLLDEPDLPAEGAVHAALATVIRRLRGDGHTIVLVTRNLDFARNVADHLVLLVDGKKIDEGPLSRMQREPASARVLEFLTWGG
jgi:ABC-type branched-subunit amino acid transport system ATPase component